MPLIPQGCGFLFNAMKIARDMALVLFDLGVGSLMDVAQLVEKMADLQRACRACRPWLVLDAPLLQIMMRTPSLVSRAGENETYRPHPNRQFLGPA